MAIVHDRLQRRRPSVFAHLHLERPFLVAVFLECPHDTFLHDTVTYERNCRFAAQVPEGDSMKILVSTVLDSVRLVRVLSTDAARHIRRGSPAVGAAGFGDICCLGLSIAESQLGVNGADLTEK